MEIVLAEPKRADAWALLADIRNWEGDTPGAIAAVSDGLLYCPFSAELHERLARYEWRHGNVAEVSHAHHGARRVAEPGDR